MTIVIQINRFQVASAVFAFFTILASSATGADWPQWRGPQRDGVSQETGLLRQWPDGGPELMWQIDNLGYGYGAPSLADGRLYVTANEGLEKEFVKALDANDGQETLVDPHWPGWQSEAASQLSRRTFHTDGRRRCHLCVGIRR